MAAFVSVDAEEGAHGSEEFVGHVGEAKHSCGVKVVCG